ncbi:MAG: trypsin-like serine protease [Candidatus Aminicenantes bacterium]|nr:trypsin-like serine protease [Candidatus Aminicenantes bacterium]NIM80710.1 trypsin-like serine protease [Candidatus Aminicenantes bacterium]NIN20085.1 trypsin-like serine protease [Candidatus Aminicenantes bacterium]NIN43872.1 trypsin-like serine protease [Candidatus Aminicenantes bacterium]NIN86681.1 trypsin-like serine protease [Candidatus Aminicenantes bacterium]
MAHQRKLAQECSVEELDRELVARGAQIPDKKRFKFKDREGTLERAVIMAQVKEFYEAAASLSPSKNLRHLTTWELAKALMFKTRKMRIEGGRGIWDDDDRKDYYQIDDGQVKKNADCVAAICGKDDLIAEDNGFFRLKTKIFGKVFHLRDREPFCRQPIAAGRLCTGFLVKEDIIATAAHCIHGTSLSQLRFLFGYKMLDFSTAVTRVPNDNIYKGVEIIDRVYRGFRGDGSDWALVKLDRKVIGQSVVTFPSAEISCGQPVYVIGHPCGLPLKYAAGARVKAFENVYFSADLDVFSGNSGSPVFASNTHELVGIVVRGDNRDFRWTCKGWISVKYPNREIYSKGAQCTRYSEFSKYCR